MTRRNTDDVPLALLRSAVTESAVDTLTEFAFNTPVSAARKLAMRLWRVWFEPVYPDPSDPGTDTILQRTQQIRLSTRQGLTVIPRIDDSGFIAAYRCQVVTAGLAAGAGINVSMVVSGDFWDFTPGGLLVATQQLSLYAQGAQETTVKTGRVMIGYTLEELDPENFFAIVSLQTQVT